MPPKKQRDTIDPLGKGYIGRVVDNGETPQNRLLVGVPMTGLLRAEWVLARYGQVVPCNWSQSDCIQWLDQFSPIRFLVADARNMICEHLVKGDFEWLLFIDHDTILPPTALLQFNEYMRKRTVPIVAGIYFTRSVPAEPLIYRGNGNSYYPDWHFGDKVWVTGHGMGCTLIHSSIIKALYEESEEYTLRGIKVRRIFETPAKMWWDADKEGWQAQTGTEDLFFLNRIIENKILEKAGWPEVARKEHPFLVDTNIYCVHIDFSGKQYPSRGEDAVFLRKKDKKKLGIE